MSSEDLSQQTEMPFAIVQGEPLSTPPQDLYIPPDALSVILEAFEGPLDLLLYLIKKQNLDILNVPVAKITAQYMEYIDMMRVIQFELAAEYLVMAAMLAEIKSRMLLPRPVEADDENDPRAELIRRLQEYEQFKQAAEDIDNLPRQERDFYLAEADMPKMEREKPLPEIQLKELLLAFKDVVKRAEMFSSHHIQRETLSVRERMTRVLDKVNQTDQFVEFTQLFTPEEGRMGVVVTFLAVLELLKNQLVDMVQSESFAPIHIAVAQQTEENIA